jgi:hypothetical protein
MEDEEPDFIAVGLAAVLLLVLGLRRSQGA